jgi:hypothetical protein
MYYLSQEESDFFIPHTETSSPLVSLSFILIVLQLLQNMSENQYEFCTIKEGHKHRLSALHGK